MVSLSIDYSTILYPHCHWLFAILRFQEYKKAVAKRFGFATAFSMQGQYFELCGEILEKEPPSSAIAKAAAYSIRQEKELRRFLHNPKINSLVFILSVSFLC